MTLIGGWIMSSRYVLVTSGDQYLFNLKAGNNEKILTSERYTTRASALGGISAVRANAAHDERYDLRLSVSGEPYFVLRGANNEVIGTSEMYSSASAREHGLAAVKSSAAQAPLDDQS
jgi:uncharacterized protein